jgi:hypothetical protein
VTIVKFDMIPFGQGRERAQSELLDGHVIGHLPIPQLECVNGDRIQRKEDLLPGLLLFGFHLLYLLGACLDVLGLRLGLRASVIDSDALIIC